jgi:hypothetical protein
LIRPRLAGFEVTGDIVWALISHSDFVIRRRRGGYGGQFRHSSRDHNIWWNVQNKSTSNGVSGVKKH